MKQFLKKTTLFLCLNFLFYAAFLILFGELMPSFLKKNLGYQKGSYGHMHTRVRDIKNYKNVDILFLGSSHAYRGFDTRVFQKYGCQAFNLGSSSQTPLQTKILLEKYLEVLNPKIVIYDAYPGTLSSDGVESTVDLIANDQKDIYQLWDLVYHQNNIKVYNTFFYGIYRDLFNLDEGFVEDKIKGEDLYISGGFVEKKLEFFEPKKSYKYKSYDLRTDQKQALVEVLGFLKSKNVRAFLLQMPITKVRYSSYTNHKEVDDFYKSLSVPYANLNIEVDLQDNKHFYDDHHLNQIGVELVNKELINRYLNISEGCSEISVK